MIQRGFYRHYKGHVYFVLGVGMLMHEGRRRVVSYTSVKAINEGIELARDEREFSQWVNPATGGVFDGMGRIDAETEAGLRQRGVVPRFERIDDPERLVLP